jgi:hypothetical protein
VYSTNIRNLHFNKKSRKMKYKDAIELFRKVRKEYFQVEEGYSDREKLQYWRQQLVFIYAELAEMTNKISSAKIYQERRKDIVRAEEYERIEAESKAAAGKSKSATAIKEEVGSTDAYMKWSEDYSKAYGRWEAFKDVKESVKVVIDSISSHLRNIQTSDYLDPK